MTMTRYTLLGRSGLRVSPISLGTMTFGTEWGWGGMGLIPWSPLGMGVLSGKYKPSESGEISGGGRLDTVGANPRPGFDKLTERNFRIVAELEAVANEAGRPMAQVALNWLHQKRGVTSIIVGATKPGQLQQSLGALDFTLAPELIARLDAVSEPARPFPYYMFSDAQQPRIHGQVEVASKPQQYDRPVRVPAQGPQG